VEEELVIEGNDKVKRHIVDIASPFLSMLNVTTQAGLIKSGMTAKYGQIQKFVEIVDNLVSKHSRRLTPEGKKRLNIVDMGCGLGYLTFACHQHFSKQFEVHTTGIETRFSLVERTNSIVKALQMNNIEFVTGTIETAKVDNMDVLIALHACDTATDDSLYQGVTIGAEIILVAPCCHKEVRRQIDLLKSVDNTAISNILSHGIYRERMAEMVTDTCRALLLEIAGYDTNVFEFIGGEHTVTTST
jgi:protein-L-isoaspartate O-methyltransferase